MHLFSFAYYPFFLYVVCQKPNVVGLTYEEMMTKISSVWKYVGTAEK